MSEENSKAQWWECIGFRECGPVMTPMFVVACRECGAEFEVASLSMLPMRCPDCKKAVGR